MSGVGSPHVRMRRRSGIPVDWENEEVVIRRGAIVHERRLVHYRKGAHERARDAECEICEGPWLSEKWKVVGIGVFYLENLGGR